MSYPAHDRRVGWNHTTKIANLIKTQTSLYFQINLLFHWFSYQWLYKLLSYIMVKYGNQQEAILLYLLLWSPFRFYQCSLFCRFKCVKLLKGATWLPMGMVLLENISKINERLWMFNKERNFFSFLLIDRKCIHSVLVIYEELSYLLSLVYLWYQVRSVGFTLRIELTTNSQLIQLANHYTTWDATI